MLRSLGARLILASLLWTAGLLLLMHILALMGMYLAPFLLGLHHGVMAAIFGLLLMILGLIGARQGLAPFRQLRERLNAVRSSPGGRVAGEYPSEVQPLIDDLNELLEDRDRAMRRALAAAGDLAHGLKTPLALLAQEAEEMRAAGNPERAGAIEQQVERMSRQVNYHLARARAAASWAQGAASCEVAPCVDALIRTMSKLYAARAAEISARVPAGMFARVQREDLDEILGNLLDNACKWAGSRIRLEASSSGAMLALAVEDDGPGLGREFRNAVLERGVRADQAAPGSGLGLAIVRDLTELYGGSVALDDSPLGGLRVTVLLPSSRAENKTA